MTKLSLQKFIEKINKEKLVSFLLKRKEGYNNLLLSLNKFDENNNNNLRKMLNILIDEINDLLKLIESGIFKYD